MILCNNSARTTCLLLVLLVSLQAPYVNALPIEQGQGMEKLILENSINQSMTSQQMPASLPPPPGPYFSSAIPESSSEKVTKEGAVPDKETATTKPIQMPAALPMNESANVSVKKVPMQTFSPDIPWPDDAAESKAQSASAKSPQSVRQNTRWMSAPPPPPGPYGFVPSYIPRSAVNSGNAYGYNGPSNPNNAYGLQYGAPMPGGGYPRMRNPAYSNPGYYYVYPEQGGFNQSSAGQGINQNNLNQNDMRQGSEKK